MVWGLGMSTDSQAGQSIRKGKKNNKEEIIIIIIKNIIVFTLQKFHQIRK